MTGPGRGASRGSVAPSRLPPRRSRAVRTCGLTALPGSGRAHATTGATTGSQRDAGTRRSRTARRRPTSRPSRRGGFTPSQAQRPTAKAGLRRPVRRRSAGPGGSPGLPVPQPAPAATDAGSPTSTRMPADRPRRGLRRARRPRGPRPAAERAPRASSPRARRRGRQDTRNRDSPACLRHAAPSAQGAGILTGCLAGEACMMHLGRRIWRCVMSLEDRPAVVRKAGATGLRQPPSGSRTRPRRTFVALPARGPVCGFA